MLMHQTVDMTVTSMMTMTSMMTLLCILRLRIIAVIKTSIRRAGWRLEWQTPPLVYEWGSGWVNVIQLVKRFGWPCGLLKALYKCSPFTILKKHFWQKTYFKRNFNYVAPEQVYTGKNSKGKDCFLQDVPVNETLKALLSPWVSQSTVHWCKDTQIRWPTFTGGCKRWQDYSFLRHF